MQRLHVNDPTGHWLEQRGEDIDHICLPAAYSAQVKPAEVKAYYDKGGGLLDPVRLSQATMDNLKKQLGSYGYAGQILQQPTPLEGSIWQPEWFKPIARKDIPELKHVGTDFDLAYTKNERNSASAWITAGVNNFNMYVTGLGFMHKEFPEMIAKMKTIPPPHYVEAMASGKSAVQTLKAQGIPAIEVRIQGGDKIARTTLMSPYAEAGNIFVASDILDELLYDSTQGLLNFPNGSHDDLNDAFTQAINRLLNKKKVVVF